MLQDIFHASTEAKLREIVRDVLGLEPPPPGKWIHNGPTGFGVGGGAQESLVLQGGDNRDASGGPSWDWFASVFSHPTLDERGFPVYLPGGWGEKTNNAIREMRHPGYLTGRRPF